MTEKVITILRKEIHIPGTRGLSHTIHSLSLTGKTLFGILTLIFIGSGLFLGNKLNSLYVIDVPDKGGVLTIGEIGLPRYLNPLLAVTDTGEDLTSLVYSGLMKRRPDGTLAPDLAERYEVSADGKTYTFTLKNGLIFHDNYSLTADDVVFTVEKAVDPGIKSPKRGVWQDVAVEKIDNQTVKFTLKQAYPWFLDNTTLGILPKHIWSGVGADEFAFSNFNMSPIGSGPYRIAKTKNDASGIPASYELRAFQGYASDEPYITTLIFKFYPSEEKLLAAYRAKEVEAISSIAPEDAAALTESGTEIKAAPLPRIFGLFFNQNVAPVFLHKKVRVALNQALNKEAIVEEILGGFGTPINSPIPVSLRENTLEIPAEDPIALASSTLSTNGWKINPSTGLREKKGKTTTETLSFSITTSDAPDLVKLAQILEREWEKLGTEIDVKVFESGNLNQEVIRPRTYDALLFGEIVNRDLDLYAFWHSSQRNDPGLNIALYANSKADKILESIRTTGEPNEKLDLYNQLEKEMETDVPAVFVYSPDFLYSLPKKVKGVQGTIITESHDRFRGIEKWYIETDHVWKIFLPNN